MPIIWAGNEIDAFDRVHPLALVSSVTTASARDSNYLPTAALGIAQHGWAETDFAEMTELWFHCEWHTSSIGVGAVYPFLLFIDRDTGQIVVQMDFDNSASTLGMEYWNGASFTEVATDDTIAANTRYVFDIHIKIDNTDGIIRYYRGNVLKGEFLGDTLHTGFNGIGRLAIGNCGTGTNAWSQMIIADQDTRNMHVSTLAPTGAGTHSAWTGASTDIDDNAIDGSGTTGTPTFIYTGSASAKESFAVANPTAAAALLNPIAVVGAARARAHGTAPDLSVGLYTSGSFYNSGGTTKDGIPILFQEQSAMLQGNYCIYHREPVLDTRWTTALLNSLEWAVDTL